MLNECWEALKECGRMNEGGKIFFKEGWEKVAGEVV